MYPEEIKETEIARCLRSYNVKLHNKKRQLAKRKKIYYTAGPYRADTVHGIVENIRKAEAVAVKIWKAGHVAMCPHLNSRLMDGTCNTEAFLSGDLLLLEKCDGVVLIDGWGKSKGTMAEIAFAMKNLIPICHIIETGDGNYEVAKI